jgi:hypothetical protein
MDATRMENRLHVEQSGFRKAPIFIALAVGLLFLPIGCPGKRTAPFESRALADYRIEDFRGGAWITGINGIYRDTLFLFNQDPLPMGDVKRISLNDTTYYLCPSCESREGEVFATEKQKAGRRESWHVYDIFALLFYAMTGQLH